MNELKTPERRPLAMDIQEGFFKLRTQTNQPGLRKITWKAYLRMIRELDAIVKGRTA